MSHHIPAHYSDRYINQRYNKALYIVQHLPNSSNVQPTKEQKLEVNIVMIIHVKGTKISLQSYFSYMLIINKYLKVI